MRWRYFRTFDWALYIVPLLLLTIGIATIYTVSYINRGSALAINQGIFASIGIILMIVLTFTDYRLWRSLVVPIYILGLVTLLLLVKPFSSLPFVISSFGATRWINLGFTQFQPSEFFKLVLIITLASYFAKNRKDFNWRNVIWAVVLTIIPVLLTLKQPDLGTASVLIVILVAMLIAVGLPRLYYLIMGGIWLVLLPVGWLFLRDYQRDRIMTFLDPGKDPLGAGYNIIQSMIAVGSGGLTGRGFGQGSQSQLNFLPVAHTDFAFAGLAEATGFVGALILIILFAILFVRILAIAKVAKDDFGMFLGVGVAAMIAFQVFINIGMNISLAPVTGIPLPFISSGGTALIICFMMLGILQSVYLRHKKITF